MKHPQSNDKTRLHDNEENGEQTIKKDLHPNSARGVSDEVKDLLDCATTNGSHIPGYTTLYRIGSGGFSTVYRARDAHGREVAIKVLKSEFARSQEIVKRFRQSANVLKDFEHPNIVRVFDVVDVGECPGLVMEFVQGQTLAEVLQQMERLPAEEAVKIASQICDALIYAHERGVIHRDVKPSNILLTSQGEGDTRSCIAKLTDFDIAKIMTSAEMTKSNMQVGTPYYVAPEQWKGSSIDGRVDVFSLGVVLYQMLTGEIPVGRFGHPSDMRPDIPRRLGSVVLKAIASNKEARYSSMVEFKKALIGDEEIESSSQIPFEFYPGRFAYSLAEIVDMCDDDWDAGLRHLEEGNIVTWLERVKPSLVPCVKEALQTKDDVNEALEASLHCLDPTLPNPVLEITPASLELGPVAPGERRSVFGTIHNPSRGYLVGRVKEKPKWLIVSPEEFHCRAGKSVKISITVKAPEGVSNQPFSGELKIVSNGGDVVIPASFRVENRLLINDTYSVGTIQEFCKAAANPENWERLRDLLYNGQLVDWLRLGAFRFASANLAEDIISQQSDKNEGLFQVLKMICPNPKKVLPPRISVSRNRVILNDRKGNLITARVQVMNEGSGSLRKLRVNSPPWIRVVRRFKNDGTENVTVEITGDPRKARIGISRDTVTLFLPYYSPVRDWLVAEVSVEMHVSLLTKIFAFISDKNIQLLLIMTAFLLIFAEVVLSLVIGWQRVLLGTFALFAGLGFAFLVFSSALHLLEK